MKASVIRPTSTFSSLKHRDFRIILITSFFASGAQWVQQITVGWLVYQLTESPFLLALAMSLKVLPALFIGPLAGVAVDRLDRRHILIGTEACLAVLSALFAVTVALGYVDIWQIFLFMFVSGAGNSMNNIVRQSIIPNLVPGRELLNAIALYSSLSSVSRILGPAAGGVLIATLGPAANFFLQSALYFGFLLMLLPLRVPPIPDRQPAVSIAGDLVEGVRHALARKEILYQLSMSFVAQLMIMPYAAMLPAYAEEVIHTGPEGLGLLYGAAGFGAVAATLFLASLGDFRRMRWLVMGSGLLASASLAFLGLSAVMYLALVAMVLLGAGQMALFSSNNTMLQKHLPDEFRGRVTALNQVGHSFQVPGSLVVGALAEMLGVGLVLVGVGLAAGAAISGLSAIFRERKEQSTPSKGQLAATELGEFDR
ncbi:MAG: MFS transporter [Chloroflexi bacterium]|nr:MFS transporter [Chloroflexota bacterium]